jgi:hypothetical protein
MHTLRALHAMTEDEQVTFPVPHYGLRTQCNRSLRNPVDDGRIDDLVDTILLSLRVARSVKHSFLGNIAHANRVVLIEQHSK